MLEIRFLYTSHYLTIILYNMVEILFIRFASALFFLAESAYSYFALETSIATSIYRKNTENNNISKVVYKNLVTENILP